MPRDRMAMNVAAHQAEDRARGADGELVGVEMSSTANDPPNSDSEVEGHEAGRA